MKLVPFDLYRSTHSSLYIQSPCKDAGIVNSGCVHAGKDERICVPRDKYVFNEFLSFLKFDMESRGIRLAKEDSMTVDGAILTADSHGDKF